MADQFLNHYDQLNTSGSTKASLLQHPNPNFQLLVNLKDFLPPPPPPGVKINHYGDPSLINNFSSSSSSSSSLNPYRRYDNYKFNSNFHTNNYSAAYNLSARISRAYNANLHSKDQYGQNYDINELDLSGFNYPLKKTKK
jgi:hypothetical protein